MPLVSRGMKVVILAGGRGTRAYPHTEYLPKPMMPIGGKPILVRVMEIFARQGFTEFVVSIGYRKEIILDYFEDRNLPWRVELVDTGVEADTGERIHKLQHMLGSSFMATYSDGLCDIDLGRLLGFHRGHPGCVTITNVPLRSQYGTVELDGDGRVVGFHEKPMLHEHRINAGFFIMDPEVFHHWEGANLERDVFPLLQRKGLLYSYSHNGFFKSMDTFKDQQEIEAMFEHGDTPWIARRPGDGSSS